MIFFRNILLIPDNGTNFLYDCKTTLKEKHKF